MNVPEISQNLLCVPAYDCRADSIADTLANVAECVSLIQHALRDDGEALEFGRIGMVLLLDLAADAIQFARNVAAGNEAAHEVVIELAATDFARLQDLAAGGPVNELASSIIADAQRKLQVTK